MSRELWRWSAVETAAAIRRRDISCVEAVQAALDRLQAVNTRVNAVTVDLSQAAREEAKRADAILTSGVAPGLLHGVPITVKENVDQRGQTTPNGVVAFERLVAAEDSIVVANGVKPAPLSLAGPTRQSSVTGGSPTTRCAV